MVPGAAFSNVSTGELTHSGPNVVDDVLVVVVTDVVELVDDVLVVDDVDDVELVDEVPVVDDVDDVELVELVEDVLEVDDVDDVLVDVVTGTKPHIENASIPGLMPLPEKRRAISIPSPIIDGKSSVSMNRDSSSKLLVPDGRKDADCTTTVWSCVRISSHAALLYVVRADRPSITRSTYDSPA